ncbi:MAG: hypothetical protein RLZZ476_2453 [Verrucomicrobiota bacterium]
MVPPTMSWPELAAQAGLEFLPPRQEFFADVSWEYRSIYALRAVVSLTEDEYKMLSESKVKRLIGWWQRYPLGDEIWGCTVEFGWPWPCLRVDGGELKPNDQHQVLHTDDPPQTRLYMLHPDESGKGGRLYYFYRSDFKFPSEDEKK